ncbi:MAG: hypothetical protein KDB27_24040 [Planctomycetales bacterium]|nr:hypothetical protein [Planctomycetales bacterium]
MRQRANATDNAETIAKDGVPDLAIDDARSCYQLKLEQWENEGGRVWTINEPTSTMRDAECNDVLRQ